MKHLFILLTLIGILLFAGCSSSPDSTPDGDQEDSIPIETDSPTKEAEAPTESTEFGVPDISLLKKAAAGASIPYLDGVLIIKNNDFVTLEIAKDYDPTARGATLLCNVTGQTYTGSVSGQVIISCVYDEEWIPMFVVESPFPDFPILHNDAPDIDNESLVSFLLSNDSSSRFTFGGSYSSNYRDGQKISFTEEEISDVSMKDWILFDNGKYAYCSGTFVCTKKLSTFRVGWQLLMAYDDQSQKWYFKKIIYTSEEIETRLPPMWRGTYNNETMGVNLILQKEFDDGTSEWLLSFYPMPGSSGASGSYTVTGTIHPGKNQFRLMDDEWVERPAGYIMLYVIGTLDPETNHVSTDMYQFELDALFEIPEGTVILTSAPEPEEIDLPGYILEAVCAYYDLTDPAEITREMLDSVTSLRISLAGKTYIGTDPYSEVFVEEDYVYHIDASINGSPFGSWGPYIRPNRYENLYMARLESDAYNQEKFDSFYTKKDINDPALTQKGLEEMLGQFPLLEKYASFYICDPSIKPRNLRYIASVLGGNIFAEDGRLNSDRTIDLSFLSQLKNLTSVEYVINPNMASSYGSMEEYLNENGLTFINSPIAVTVVQRDPFDMAQYNY